jgi:uncharacterized repeat protein (TIGR03803 family)
MAILFAVTIVLTQSAQAQTFKVILNFTNGQDGARPYAGLTMDAAGNLYGTTFGNSGGSNGNGSVFKLKHFGSGWILNPLYDYAGGNDGAWSWGRLARAQDGTFYGTTWTGGGSGIGTVFQVKPFPTAPVTALAPWSETVTYVFTGGNDGAAPQGDLTFDQSGNVYGVTNYGGDAGNGVVYELTPSGGGWTQAVLYSFQGADDGANPYGGVVFDQAGNLYGVVNYGGTSNSGAVYELSPSGSGWTKTALYNFTGGNDGATPYGGLTIDASGNLYGTTAFGGVGGGGTVFELTPANGGGWSFNTLYSFSGSGYPNYGPMDKLTMDAAGNLYGTTYQDGGFQSGSVFKLTPSGGGWSYTSLHDFTGASGGAYPISILVLDTSGNLYGTASAGGANGFGMVFEITPSGLNDGVVQQNK